MLERILLDYLAVAIANLQNSPGCWDGLWDDCEGVLNQMDEYLA